MSLKLITRLQSNRPIDGYTHRDSQPGTVERFCKKYDFPYSDKFVCIFIYRSTDDHNAPGSHLGYGEPYLLNEEIVLHHIQIACSDDIQNCAANALSNEGNKQKLGEYLRRFADLRKLTTPDEIRSALLGARENMQAMYAEARILRSLSTSDIRGRA